MSLTIKALVGLYGLIYIVFLTLLVLVIVKRRRSLKKENFERRDN
jgi:hypothetical protein